jgi:hypothetical protein
MSAHAYYGPSLAGFFEIGREVRHEIPHDRVHEIPHDRVFLQVRLGILECHTIRWGHCKRTLDPIDQRTIRCGLYQKGNSGPIPSQFPQCRVIVSGDNGISSGRQDICQFGWQY